MSMQGLAVGPQPVEVDGASVLYGDGRTKQAFRDETDINKILAKAQRVGSLSHLVRHGATYGDFADVPDLLTAHARLKKGQEVFAELPSEVRREFSNDMFKFYEYVNDPANVDRLPDLLPGLARPGAQNPEVLRGAPGQAAARAAADAERAPDPRSESELKKAAESA